MNTTNSPSYRWWVILAILAAVPLLAAAPRSLILRGTIVGVHDGDSCTLLVGTTQHKIRLEGIDTPELGQPFGTRAKQGLSKYIFSRQVTVHVSGKDSYGRSLGTILVDGKSINLQLVTDGLAWHYKQYSNDRKLAQAESSARRAKRGLWADADAMAPWQWRRMRTSSSAARALAHRPRATKPAQSRAAPTRALVTAPQSRGPSRSTIRASARSAALTAMSDVVSPSAAKWRRSMPERARIHSSDVSTKLSNQLFGTTRSGR